LAVPDGGRRRGCGVQTAATDKWHGSDEIDLGGGIAGIRLSNPTRVRTTEVEAGTVVVEAGERRCGEIDLGDDGHPEEEGRQSWGGGEAAAAAGKNREGGGARAEKRNRGARRGGGSRFAVADA
jgi:hypothetical protein